MTFFSSLAWTGISFVLFSALVAIISAWKTRDEQLDTTKATSSQDADFPVWSSQVLCS